jgi:hypothetical protein
MHAVFLPNIISTVTKHRELAVKWTTLLLRVRYVLDSILGLDITHLA